MINSLEHDAMIFSWVRQPPPPLMRLTSSSTSSAPSSPTSIYTMTRKTVHLFVCDSNKAAFKSKANHLRIYVNEHYPARHQLICSTKIFWSYDVDVQTWLEDSESDHHLATPVPECLLLIAGKGIKCIHSFINTSDDMFTYIQKLYETILPLGDILNHSERDHSAVSVVATETVKI